MYLIKFLFLILLFSAGSLSNEINKSKIEPSLTQKYIDSLREGKWGITDPDWVNIDMAKEFFTSTSKIRFFRRRSSNSECI